MPLPIPAEKLPTQEELREMFTYCALSGALRWRESRGPAKAGGLAGHIGLDGYRRVKVNGRALLAHRVAFCWAHGYWPDNTVDHANGRKWDNRIFNLREATHLEQTYNQPARRDNRSGVAGVGWHSEKEKWRARIKINGVETFLGYYVSLEEAKLAREEKAKEVQGEFYRGQ